MEQYELLGLLADCFESLGVRYFVTGSLASMAYGEPRLTNDIDIVAELSPEHVPGMARHFPSPDFHFDEEMAGRAILRRHQFNVIHPASGLKADIIIAKPDEFDRSRFARARRLMHAEDREAVFASPEDVIVKKLVFHAEGGSDKHLRDIAGMLKVSPELIDLDYVATWADRLGVLEGWEAILSETGGRRPASPEPGDS
jgi:hypothetical protein